jgi:hypothetical protein
MTVRTRNLLDRFRVLVIPNVVIFNDPTLDVETSLRMINIRQLVEAVELARMIHSEIMLSLKGQVSQTTDDVVEQINHLGGASYWTRRRMMQAAQGLRQSVKDPLTSAYDELQEAVKVMKRRVTSTLSSEVDVEVELCVRKFPQIIRNFYEHVDYALPIY